MIERDLFDLPYGDFGVILADPPWRYHNWSTAGEAKNALAHYPCMELDELERIPVDRLAGRDCALFMWATGPKLRDAFHLMNAWGFEYVSFGAWGKRTKLDNGWAFPLGYTWRATCEPLLLGRRGKPRIIGHRETNLIVAPAREHSRKPDDLYGKIERMYGGPYLELFARQRWPGWHALGNETDKFIAEPFD